MLSLETAVLTLALLGSGQGETVLLDFCADWCIPCRQMDPAVRELAAKGYPVRKVNIDRERALAAQYGVSQVPCFVMLVEGKVVDRVVGGTTYSRLERMCQLAQSRRDKAQTRPPQAPAPPAASSQPLPFAQGASPPPGNGQPSATMPPGSQAQTPASPAGWRQGVSDWRGTPDAPSPNDAKLIAATVRLRIEDPTGHSCGSGTIIDARNGQALILTCGHIFRDSKGQGRIEVDLFGPSPAERIPGRLLSYDLERDIGLLTIAVPGPVVTAGVAPPGYRIAPDDRTVNVGCSNGELPTARHSRVTSVDRYLGPPNLEVTGTPVEGRSGGGLFSEEGLVIGVCMAANTDENKGLFSALAAIQAELDKADLSFAYCAGAANSAQGGSLAGSAPPVVPERMPPPSDLAQQAVVPAASPADLADRPLPSARGQLRGKEQAALEEIRRRRLEGAEVVCVIRSRSDPRAPSEIIVLDQVSPSFLNQLAAEASLDKPNAPHFTSLEIPVSTASTQGPTVDPYGAPSTRAPLIEYRTSDRRDPSASRGAGW